MYYKIDSWSFLLFYESESLSSNIYFNDPIAPWFGATGLAPPAGFIFFFKVVFCHSEQVIAERQGKFQPCYSYAPSYSNFFSSYINVLLLLLLFRRDSIMAAYPWVV